MLYRLLAVFCLLASPMWAETVTINTFRGSAEVAKNPDKVVVFDISALDSLDALGVEIDGVVSPVFVDYVDDTTEGAVPVGNLFEPDFEAVAALAPDLIIAGGRSHKVVPKLARIAPTIDMTVWQDTVEQGKDRLLSYGKIFGKEAKAEALIAEFDKKAAAAKASLQGKGTALIIMTVGPKVSAYGAAGRFGWLHQITGLPEAVEGVDQSAHGEAVSFEFIREADPDILIVIDRLAAIGRDGARAEATLDNALVHDTKAWKNGKVIFLESAPLYIAGGGIQSMTRMIETITGSLADE